MKKVLHILPHLSTGGCPQFAYDLIRKTKNNCDAYVIEYAFFAPDFVVQRNKVIELMGEKFFSLNEDKSEIFKFIERINPDVIHFQEFPEYFMEDHISERIYNKQRSYVIIETSHDSGFNPSQKRFFSDHLALISQWQINKFEIYGIPITLLQSDIEIYNKVDRQIGLINLGLDPNKKHVLNVGLWTSRKNQGEIVEYAKQLKHSHPNIQFHFVGNQAGNFQSYWEPLIKDLPNNCKVWGERNDVHNFYSCMDLFLFTSRGMFGDMETSPLVLREATGHKMPILMYNLSVYLNQYENFDNINYLNFDNLQDNLEIILFKLSESVVVSQNTYIENNIKENKKNIFINMENKKNNFKCEIDKTENKITLFYQNSVKGEVSISVQDIDSGHAIYAFDSYFENYSSLWTIPVPVQALNHYNRSGYFRGYKIQIFERNRTTLLEEHIVWYNESAPYFERVKFESDPWNLTWINYTEMFVEDFYNPLQMKISGVCLDIGANDGLYTEYLLRNGADRVYSIECDPRSVKFLNKRFNSNERVVIVDKALFDENKVDVKLAYKNDTSTVSSLIEGVHHFNEGNYYYVNTWDYTTLLHKYNISNVDFFKIDIEGAEYNVFRSMTDLQITQIKAFMVEIHWNQNGKIYEITDRLESLGYEIELRRHTEDNAIVVNREEWKNYDLCTFYASKPNDVIGKNLLKPIEVKTFDQNLEDNLSDSEYINVQLHHLRTTLNTDVEIESLNNIRNLANFLQQDVRFGQVILTEYENEPFKDIPPRENCARPDAISLRPFPNGVNEIGQTALTPAHYGCFDSFKKAFLDTKISEKTSLDFHVFFEGDAFVDNFNEFASSFCDISNAISTNEYFDLHLTYISFGGIYHLETGDLLSHCDGNIKNIDWGYFSRHIPFAHGLIIPTWYMPFLRKAFEEEPWDVTDLFFMNHFRNNPDSRQFVSKHQIVRQLNGFSLIDKKVKIYQHK